MKERPILFSTEMVKAILDGRKTMTRRIVKFPSVPEWHDWDYDPYEIVEGWPYKHYESKDKSNNSPLKCPFGTVGDILWVRETWAPALDTIAYKADFSEFLINKPENKGIWKPSIFMPRSASRISLRIANIRVERLNDITEEDAKREGVLLHRSIDPNDPNLTHKWRFPFCILWESINGKGSWDQNPWVWVISFEVVPGPHEILKQG
ncbi:hypothetical protein EHQ23_19450 [Leptospira bourretii]|uniref:Morphogenetic protein n=1 Tax=Leptospira bourretii TaxID=2484962 RepID=A0A4R9ISA3_9LEPT|nr:MULTISPECIES: hypothetical protein [Leptospira]TGK79232.1 hypothetical protein EHQ23_19450 [Leptospira bourretii]TGK94342.1 hypothetical protein EHQ26_03140 [Leptospira bourretii]TGL16833.1 hypothetical protein EHQ42_10925 [Leptospira levettii]TGL38836.1 hypothetical protein EHQ45_04500 [Leptospira bourretii]